MYFKNSKQTDIAKLASRLILKNKPNFKIILMLYNNHKNSFANLVKNNN